MIEMLTPRQAEALLKDGDVDLIDVREPHEWEVGHVPGARLVPLAALKAEPRRHLTRDRVLLVCARGQRSLTAARVAEELGLASVCSLQGGTVAWVEAGL